MSEQANPSSQPAEPNQLLKLLIDLGPLVAFFAAYARSGIYWATGILMGATVIALIASRILFGRFAVAPMVTAVVVVVFGGLTFWLEDPRFIMLKPTIINLLFAGVLGFGLFTGRPLLKVVMGEAVRLTDEGWHKLTVRWIAFFVIGVGFVMGEAQDVRRPILLAILAVELGDRPVVHEGWHKLTVRWIAFFVTVAALNEVVWRNFSEATWVAFKAWGILPLTLIFAVAQIGLIRRYEAKIDAPKIGA